MNTIDILSPLLAEQADKIALIYNGQKISYGSLFAAVSHLAYGLAVNFRPGTILAIWLPNSPELVSLYLACLKTGIIPMPMHQGMKWPEVRNILKLSRARYLITTKNIVSPHSTDIVVSELERVYVIDPGQLQKPFLDYAELVVSGDRIE